MHCLFDTIYWILSFVQTKFANKEEGEGSNEVLFSVIHFY